MTLFSSKTIQTFVAALPAPLPELCYRAYGARLRPRPKAARYALALGFVSLLFLVVALLDQAILPTIVTSSAPTPYRVLGVTTASTHSQITYAYTQLTSDKRGSARGTYKDAYTTLADPLQRCVYHRDNKIPDWYGVPQSCKGELAVDKLQAAKRIIRDSKVVDDSFDKIDAKIQILRDRLQSFQLKNKTNPAEPVKPTIPEKASRTLSALWRRTVNTPRGCSQWLGSQVKRLSFSPSVCLSWLRIQTQVLLHSTSRCVAVVKQRLVSIPVPASSALWAVFFSALCLVLVWVSLNVYKNNPGVHPMAIFSTSTLLYLRLVRRVQEVWGVVSARPEEPAQSLPEKSNSAAVEDQPTA
jgi:hypothetical protein